MSYSEYDLERKNDIEMGAITIKSCALGWIFPGGKQTTNREAAIKVALRLNQQVARWEERQISDQKRSQLRQPILGYSRRKY